MGNSNGIITNNLETEFTIHKWDGKSVKLMKMTYTITLLPSKRVQKFKLPIYPGQLLLCIL